ncbi:MULTISPECIES: DUF4148 domain-containing protein [unclassified Herbaspirillum]|uniref:DUF4148 domain-containing protein n=1 Tax=unclassified Herbaspirillum TaxID=2624150 RepID=UPI0011505A50|nr:MULTISPECIES: DUF4148 domain-containing protein [unclassified Herbaspirillum]MBB5390646.1 hypothetical protein [Herbaspirillum sp. SJZ102]TQK08868.1 uncharacterized protein DUF4148 [Herbaspirillum sp. SJZ130]TQK14445.1 uncharacterized protein DUF4148 [Herbaspirillum sp. SJZ106]TWC66538.1 uncharacterized protein DUF4148 [Herbaspirillum sp. SJZ099]
MNTRHLLIALALAATSGAVLAQNVSVQAQNVQGKTRAQVIEELKQARADGTLTVSDYDYPRLPAFVSTKTRAQVIEELKVANAQGLVTVGDADYPKLPAFVSTKSRAQVQAELVEYQKHPDPQGLYRGY